MNPLTNPPAGQAAGPRGATADHRARGSVAALTLGEAAAAIAGGDISAESYASALLARANETADLGVFVSMEPQMVLAAARAVDLKRSAGEALGSLAGVPLLVKDNIDVAGLPTTACTPALRNHVPSRNAVVIDQLLAADAIVFGKAAMHELASGGTCHNPGFGTVRNPYARDHIAGGSSGGTGAGIAARISPPGSAPTPAAPSTILRVSTAWRACGPPPGATPPKA
jgi:mandelamide amidase